MGFSPGKLNLSVDLSYSLGNTKYDTSPFAGSDLESNTCSAIYYETCGSLPTNQEQHAAIAIGRQLPAQQGRQDHHGLHLPAACVG